MEGALAGPGQLPELSIPKLSALASKHVTMSKRKHQKMKQLESDGRIMSTFSLLLGCFFTEHIILVALSHVFSDSYRCYRMIRLVARLVAMGGVRLLERELRGSRFYVGQAVKLFILWLSSLSH